MAHRSLWQPRTYRRYTIYKLLIYRFCPAFVQLQNFLILFYFFCIAQIIVYFMRSFHNPFFFGETQL